MFTISIVDEMLQILSSFTTKSIQITPDIILLQFTVVNALSTVKQESLVSVLFQKEQISGPPKYLTTDWKAAEESVKKIHDLKPSLIIPSHGQPMEGEELSRHLDLLAQNFKEIAVPEHGRYVDR